MHPQVEFSYYNGNPEGVLNGDFGALVVDFSGGPPGVRYRKTTASGTLTGWVVDTATGGGFAGQHALNAGDEYEVQLSDNGKVFHDGLAAAGAGHEGVWLRLPPIADALAAHFQCFVLSTRELLANGYENCIAVYYAGYSTAVPFLIGATTLGSLYSTGKGDRLRLYPVTVKVDGSPVNRWAAEAVGLWQDRD
jgi:hypothetical protein